MGSKGDRPPPTERPPPLEDVAARVAALIDRGLRRYGKGDLEGALGEWELALALDPDAKAAEDYIAYVRENFEQLAQSFQAEKEIVEQVRSEGIPVPEDEVNEDDFPEIEVTEAGASGARPVLPRAGEENGPALPGRLSHEMSAAVDEGWELDELGPRPETFSGRPSTETSGGMPIVTVQPRTASETPLEDSLLAGGATADDFEYSDLMPPSGVPVEDIPSQTIRQPPPIMGDVDLAKTEAGPPAVVAGADDPLGRAASEGGFGDGDALEDQATQTRQSMSGSPALGADDDEPDYVHEFKDEFSSQTTDVLPNDGDPTGGGEAEIEHEHGGGPPPPLDFDAVVEFTSPATGSKRRPTMDPQAPVPLGGAPKPEPLLALFVEARDAAERNDLTSAVVAIERYFDADPELTHLDAREREIFLRIFEGFLGRVDQVPLVAVPMHEISAANLDHRTGFLLSRIDGMLTFEDILDVAGMSRLEAYRILGSLLRRGFIEVR